MVINYDGRIFRSVSNSSTGEVGSATLFHYHQRDQIVWAEYCGGSIVRGMLIATVNQHGELDMRYQHVNLDGEIKTGVCRSKPELLPDGRYRVYEKWTWTCGEGSSGESIIEELPVK